jgi:hypothetical protein
MSQVSLVPILLWVAALSCAGIAAWREPRPILRDFVVDRLLRYLFLFPLGLQGLWAFVGHVVFPAQSAASIGWATSPSNMKWGSPISGSASLRFMPPSEASKRGLPWPAAACFLPPIAIVVLLILASGKMRQKSPATLALEAELEVARKALRDYRDALSELGK